MINLGIYIDTLANTEQLELVANCLNGAVENNSIKDASLFYDDIGHNPFNIKCGIFNSTDLWNFSGELITTSINNTQNAVNIVNNISLYYYHGFEEKINVIELLYVLQNKIEIICNSEEGYKEIYRLTGKKPLGISNKFDNILSIIKGSNNGCSKNRRHVCRAE
jgi:hypothetical protein